MKADVDNVTRAVERAMEQAGSFENSGQWPRLVAEAAVEAVYGPPELRPSNDRGQRWPGALDVPGDWLVEAERMGLDREQARVEAAKFVDYWVSQPGKDGRKVNWRATWRNWVRRALGPRVATATRVGEADRVRY